MVFKYIGYRGARVVKTCKHCDKDFETLKLKDTIGKELYCSKECYQLFRKVSKKDRSTQNKLYQKKHKYNLSESEYKKLLEAGICDICKARFDENKAGVACVDHNHITGKVRGVLCQSCNKGLGLFKDSIEFLVNAIQYLTENK